QRPGGRQQQDEADQGQGREGGGRLVQHGRAGGGQRARADQQPVDEVLGGRGGAGGRQGEAHKQPAHRGGRAGGRRGGARRHPARRGGRAAGGHDRPDRGRAHQGQDGNGDGREVELDQLGAAGLAQQLGQPRHGGPG